MSDRIAPLSLIQGGRDRAIDDFDARVEAAWVRYLDARDRAERSRDLRDAKASGQAFADFHYLFVGARR